MAQISFEEPYFKEALLLDNFERLFRHESSDTIVLTKSYDMLNYITDFSNLKITAFLESKLNEIIKNISPPEVPGTEPIIQGTGAPVTGTPVAPGTGAPVIPGTGPAVIPGTGPVAPATGPVTPGTASIIPGPVIPGTGPAVIPGTGPVAPEVLKVEVLDSPKLKLLKKIKSELLNSHDNYIIDKYIIIFMQTLIKTPFEKYEECDSTTIIEIIDLLCPISQFDSIVTKKDKIKEIIHKSPIVKEDITGFLNPIKENKDLSAGLKPVSETNIHFIWQKTISIIKPFFDKFRASTEPIRGGNIISLVQLKSKIREKVEKIIPKKSLDY